jgi:ABC-type multidrug transport system fused ATPase/permease subunit
MSLKRKLSFLWHYSAPYKKTIIILLVLSVIVAVFESIGPVLYGKMTDTVLGQGGLLGLSIWQLASIWAIIALFTMILDEVVSYYVVKVEMAVDRDATVELCQHAVNLPVSYHYNQKPGEVLKIIDRTGDAFRSIYELVIFNFLASILMMIVALIVMFSTNWQLALIILCTIVAYFTVGTQYRMKEILQKQQAINTGYNKLYGNIGDMLSNIFAVKTNTAENYEVKDKQKAFGSLIKIVMKQMLNWVRMGVAQNLISRSSYIVVIVMAVYLLAQNKMTAGSLVMFIAYLAMVYRPLGMLTNNFRWLRRRLVDLEDAIKIKEVDQEKDLPNARTAILHGEVEFQNISFKYPEREMGTLEHISFKVPKGNTLAIFGETGSGKTTVYNLLFQLYEQEEGEILFDGVDSREIKRSSMREQIAVVPQDPILFNESISDNIRYGKQSATKNEVIAAAKIANAHEFIMDLPKDYETKVGERGVKLSGGQVQRVAIARAALRNPKILILDEATSSLDPKVKFEVLDALQKLISGRTTIIITHDFSAITQSADQIIVLDQGKIVQQGKHQELVGQRGIYRDYWDIQQKHLQQIE